jgi:hypothetical protein
MDPAEHLKLKMDTDSVSITLGSVQNTMTGNIHEPSNPKQNYHENHTEKNIVILSTNSQLFEAVGAVIIIIIIIMNSKEVFMVYKNGNLSFS